jgi:parallel beta-helix repeat protein
MTVNSKTNTIHGTGSNAEGFLINAANGTVQNNAISGITQGIYLELSGATIATNTISATAIGLYIVGGSNNVTNNRIDAGGFLGVYLTSSATNSVVEKNTIGNAETAVTGCGGLGGTPPPPASGFTVTGNIITDAATGTEMPSGNTSAPNKFYATSMAVQACHQQISTNQKAGKRRLFWARLFFYATRRKAAAVITRRSHSLRI